MKTRLTALAALAFLGSCSAQYAPVSMDEVCAFPTPASGVCLYTSTCTNTLAGTAILDVATAGYDFVLPIQFTNQLTSSANAGNGTVDANQAYIETMQIQYGGAPAMQTATLPVTITVPTAGSTTSVVSLIPLADFAKLPVVPGGFSTVVMSLQAKGVFLSQQSFTTATFQIPVTICSGCLGGNPCPTGQNVSGVCPQLGQTNAVSCQ